MSNSEGIPPRRILSTEPSIQDVLDEVESINRNIGSMQTELERIKLAIEALQKSVDGLNIL